jgi:thioesterase domain-containing protein
MLGLGQMFDDAPTVAGLARQIEVGRVGAGWRDSSGLVPVKSTGDLPPLFAVPGREGNPFPWVHLAHALSHRQPLYLLEFQGLDGSKPPLESIPEIAALLIRSIRKLQSAGPYYLTGTCFGGRVAFEMARQLQACGERVGLLIMLDPSAPFTDSEGRPRATNTSQVPAKKKPSIPRYIVERFTFHAKHIASLRGDARRVYLRQKLRHMGEIVRQRDVFRGNRSGLYEQFQRAVEEANLRAGRRYIPTPYDGHAILCIDGKGRAVVGHREFRLDWMQLLPRCDHPIFVDGEDAWSMMNASRAPRLANQIEAWLEAARREGPRSEWKNPEPESMAIL